VSLLYPPVLHTCGLQAPVTLYLLVSFQGSCFIRTDQLDGETDWKLKVAVSCTQRLPALGVSIPVITAPSHLVRVPGSRSISASTS